jgi:FkbM family methyltransferase
MVFEINFKKILQYVNPKIIFEFGSFKGATAIKYRNWFVDSDIYTMEPNPLLFDRLLANTRPYNIKCYRVGFGNSIGRLPFTTSQGKTNDAHTGFGGFLYPTELYKEERSETRFRTRGIKVDVTTIKKFCETHDVKKIDFMHIVVEGYIKEVLEGMGDIRPLIICAEVIDNEKFFIGAMNRTQCTNMFKDMGYEEILSNESERLVVYILRDYIKKIFLPEQLDLFDILTKGKNKANEIVELTNILNKGKNEVSGFVELVKKIKSSLKSNGDIQTNNKNNDIRPPIEITGYSPVKNINKSIIKTIIDKMTLEGIIGEYIKEILSSGGGMRPLIIYGETTKDDKFVMGVLNHKQCSDVFKKMGKEKILMSEVNKSIVYILKDYINNLFEKKHIDVLDILKHGEDKLNELCGLVESLKLSMTSVEEHFKSNLLK